jgi:hypothetical protein
MATYGEPGKNPYTIKGIGGILSNVVDDKTGVSQIYRQGALGTFQTLGTYNPKTNQFTPNKDSNLTTTEVSSLSNQTNLTNIKNASVKTAQAAGVSPEKAQSLVSSNTASSTESSGGPAAATTDTEKGLGLTQEQSQASVERNVKSEKGPLLRYPINNSYQGDYIQIEMRSYQKSGFQSETDTLTVTRMEDREYSSKRFIYLPIQSGIVDSISVDWGNGEINPITAQFANLAMGTIVESGRSNPLEAGQKFLNNFGAISDKLLNSGNSDIQKLVANYFTEQAIGTPGLLSRSIGGAINNNLELLFNGPTLRSFTFNFKLTPREPKEAQVIKEIIRVFKKGMSPALSNSGLFLSAPNVFKLKYIYTGKGNLKEDHPYLNKIKVAALRDFSVNYTPDGNYMTYNGEGSMTQYDLSMTFGEIDPVYAQDYDEEQGSKGMGW